MTVFSIIQKSQLEGTLRFDAEYYQPEYLLNSLKLEKIGFQMLQDLSISNITKGETPRWRGDSYLDTGIPFLRSENLIFAGTDLSDIVFVSEKVHERMKRSKILPNDVLLAIVGATIGHTGLVGNEYSEYNSNQAIAIVRPENEKAQCENLVDKHRLVRWCLWCWRKNETKIYSHNDYGSINRGIK